MGKPARSLARKELSGAETRFLRDAGPGNLALLRRPGGARIELAAARQHPIGVAGRGGATHFADKHRSLVYRGAGRAGFRLPYRRRILPAMLPHHGDAFADGALRGAFAQLVRHAHARAAESALRFHGGQRKPDRGVMGSRAGMQRCAARADRGTDGPARFERHLVHPRRQVRRRPFGDSSAARVAASAARLERGPRADRPLQNGDRADAEAAGIAALACIGERRTVVLGVAPFRRVGFLDECGGSLSAMDGNAGFTAGFLVVRDRPGRGEDAPPRITSNAVAGGPGTSRRLADAGRRNSGDGKATGSCGRSLPRGWISLPPNMPRPGPTPPRPLRACGR